MKKHFKLITALALALLLFVSNTPIANAAENDKTQTGSNEETEQNQYKYTVTYDFVDWGSYTGGHMTATYITNKPLYAYYYEPGDGGKYLYFFCGDLSDYPDILKPENRPADFDTSSSYPNDNLKGNGSVSYITYKPDGTTSMTNVFGGSGLTYKDKVRVTASATCPIFSNYDSLYNHLATGSTDGWENYAPDEVIPSSQKTLPYLQNVTWHINPNCYGNSSKIIGDEFTWDTSELYPAAKIEVKADVIVYFKGKNNILNHITAIPASSFTISTTADIIVYNDKKTWISSPSYDSGYLLIPSDKFNEGAIYAVSDDPDFDYSAVEKVAVTSYYLRMVFYDEEENVLHVGGWTKVNVQSGLTSKEDFIMTGDFDPDTGEYIQDANSEGSYSYGTNIDGSYDFDGSNGMPKDIADAFSQFVDIIGALLKSIGSVPALVKTVFGFLPNIFFVLIGGSFTLVVILRILGR